jgi:hypothetical protein
MPPPSLNNDVAIMKWKDHLGSANFSIELGPRGRAAAFRPNRGGRFRGLERYECLGLDHFKDS